MSSAPVDLRLGEKPSHKVVEGHVRHSQPKPIVAVLGTPAVEHDDHRTQGTKRRVRILHLNNCKHIDTTTVVNKQPLLTSTQQNIRTATVIGQPGWSNQARTVKI